MKAKLLGAVSAAALMGWVSVANAQGPMQLTEAQLDGITAGQSVAGVSATAVGPGAFVSGNFVASALNEDAFAAINATNFAGQIILGAFAASLQTPD